MTDKTMDQPALKRHVQSIRSKQALKLHEMMNRLSDCALGVVEMNTAQVSAAGIWLRKVMPDEQHIAVEQVEQGPRTNAEIQADILEALRVLRETDPAEFRKLAASMDAPPKLIAVDAP